MFQMMSPGVDYNLTMSRTDGKMTVLVLPKANGLKDEAQRNLVPFTMTGAADEIDRGFFAAIQQPVARAAGMLTNMAAFEKQTDKAAANSKGAKNEKAQADKDEKLKKEKYDGFMKKAEELETAGNLDGALTQLQQARLHATDKTTKTVDEKIAALKAKASQGSLFGDSPAPPAAIPITPEQSAPQPAQEQLQTVVQPAQPPQVPQPGAQMVPPQQPPMYPPMQGQPSQQPPQGYPGYPQMPQGGQPGYGYGMFGAAPVPGQGYPQPTAPQNIPQGGSFVPPNPAFAPGDFPHDPKDYEGIPDVHLTHVGQMLSNPQAQV